MLVVQVMPAGFQELSSPSESGIGAVWPLFLASLDMEPVWSQRALPRHSLRAICTVLLDPRDPLLQSERTQGFAADPVYVKGEVLAYVGLPQNLKDLKDEPHRSSGVSHHH